MPILQRSTLLLLLALLSLGSLLFALTLGSVSIPLENFADVFSHQDSLQKSLVLELRLPRALAAFVTGAMLALAGALMQVLLRNPLADPYVLGISGGAASGALAAILMGTASWFISSAAFLGAIFTMALVFGLARNQGSWSSGRLLLTGVVIASGWGAVISFLLSISPDAQLHSMLFWLMGDLSQAQMPDWQFIVLLLAFSICMPIARSLNLLAQGELQAGALGVSVPAIRFIVYFTASLLTASAVSLAGSIGFIGLVTPHVLRLMSASDHRILLPASMLLGGCLLVLADTLARTVMAPIQLPVGVLTALLGVPLFLYLLYRSR